MQDLQVDGGQEVPHRGIISNIRAAQDHPGSQTPAIKAVVREAWGRGLGRQGGLPPLGAPGTATRQPPSGVTKARPLKRETPPSFLSFRNPSKLCRTASREASRSFPDTPAACMAK